MAEYRQLGGRARLRDLSVGQEFRFPRAGSSGGFVTYTYRGQGWYGTPYDGGPWHDGGENPVVVPPAGRGGRKSSR